MTVTMITGSAEAQLSVLIRTGTAEAHQAAEHTPFVQDLLAGRLPVTEYARLVAQHHAIYSVLEAAVGENDDPGVAPFLAPELTRLPALVEDLEFLAGPTWRQSLPVLPATVAYATHLRMVCGSWPGGLLAHHYVRYLGDLSGGQLIGRVLQRVYGFAGSDGTRFYRFSAIPSAKAFKTRYRELLDALPWTTEDRQRLIDEVNVAYQFNTDVFLELAPLPVFASESHAAVAAAAGAATARRPDRAFRSRA